MLETNKAFADKVGYAKLSADCQEALDRFSKELIPLPKGIPDYIDNWRQKVKPGDLAARMTLEECSTSRRSAQQRYKCDARRSAGRGVPTRQQHPDAARGG
ncbi:hypothetical protein ACVBEH_16505 [Roseateles sp. GG27B]